MTGIERRGEGIRQALEGERPVQRPLVMVCAWCPDVRVLTELARERGEEVTHGMCAVHAEKFRAEMDAAEAHPGGPTW